MECGGGQKNDGAETFFVSKDRIKKWQTLLEEKYVSKAGKATRNVCGNFFIIVAI